MTHLVLAVKGVPPPAGSNGLASSRGQAALTLSGASPERVLFEMPFHPRKGSPE